MVVCSPVASSGGDCAPDMFVNRDQAGSDGLKGFAVATS